MKVFIATYYNWMDEETSILGVYLDKEKAENELNIFVSEAFNCKELNICPVQEFYIIE